MGETTGISWTDHTCNLWWGCWKIAPECEACYAAEWDNNAHWGRTAPRRFFGDRPLNDLRKWNRKAEKERVRRKVFCCSMADIFEIHPVAEINAQMNALREQFWQVVEESHWLIFQLVTKRIENVWTLVPERWLKHGFPENVWMLATLTTDPKTHEPITEPIYDHLMRLPVGVRGLSVEPMLAKMEIIDLLGDCTECAGTGLENPNEPAMGPFCSACDGVGGAVNWVIIGGESNQGSHKGRKMELEWAMDLIDDCRERNVPVFVKQLGNALAADLGVKKAGKLLHEWPPYLQVQEFPKYAALHPFYTELKAMV